MEYDFEKICRVCLVKSDEMMSLFKVNVSRKIMACASVQVWPNDELPAQICNKCCAKLHVAFQFKKLCEKSDSKLRTYIAENGRMKSNKKQIQSSDSRQHSVNNQGMLNKQLEGLNKHQDVHQEQLQHHTLDTMHAQNNCRFVECSDIVDVYVQDSSYVQNGQPIQGSLGPMNNFNTAQPTIQAPLQIGNYNVSNVVYSNSYPITLQPPPLMHNQMLTSIPMQPIQQETPPNIQQIPGQAAPSKKETTTENNSIEANSDKMKNEKNSDNPNQCPVCLKIFLNSTKKNRHMKIHSKTDMPYKCSVCSKEFTHGGNYKIHMRMHNNERPFKCTMCPKGFVQAQDLEKHMRTHTGERPHKCPMCWKAFSAGSNLIAHIRTHTGERPYVCCVCSKAFCQSNELTKHMRTHTGEKSHRCDICNKGFNGSSTLIVHKRSHTGEKPFMCKVCSKSFSQSSCLSAHLKRYGESKYPCDLCNVSFHSEKVLQEHEKTEEHNSKLFKCQSYSKHVVSAQSGFDKHVISEHIDTLSITGS
ncbi:zinc finger protein 79-like isoform X1 [Coccinella septempunctata]|uniref:zinc finger protein 79-like isoform X1 n=2 Tax=Coccinella septempunctata TaxID=41139 RepID=UPI001D09806E|nr:zinc finger protein 79-like isoform X1 [Coccinella septempunctata]